MADNKYPDSLETHQDETISDSFICCVCLDLLYKPIVLECGHVSCFWCVHKSMDGLHESHCPICRHPYHHFPTVCEMLHFLLVKLYPLAYRRREKQIFGEEKANDCFSPQLDCDKLTNNDGSRSTIDTPSCNKSVDKDSSKIESNDSHSVYSDKPSEMISSGDVLCGACKQLLFRPVVLNCGHVYCEVCIAVPEVEIIICKVCECPHPSDCPNVCLEFNNFLEEQFPKEYASRRGSVKQIEAHSQHKNVSSGIGSTKKGLFTPFRGSEDFIPWWNEHGSKVHAGAGCDYCGMFPIVGDRYRCQDCMEMIGFDLCGDCYKTQSKRPGRFNQQHTPDHRFELVKQPDVLQNIMMRLVGGRHVDSSGAPVLAISAIEEEPQDGWIAIESVDASENTHSNATPHNGTTGDIMLDNSGTQDGSMEMEFRDSPQVSGTDLASVSHDDHDGDQDGSVDLPVENLCKFPEEL